MGRSGGVRGDCGARSVKKKFGNGQNLSYDHSYLRICLSFLSAFVVFFASFFFFVISCSSSFHSSRALVISLKNGARSLRFSSMFFSLSTSYCDF